MISKDIFNMTELCYLKIKVEPLRPKIGPAQCFSLPGIFPLVQILHEESEMRQSAVSPTSPGTARRRQQRRQPAVIVRPGKEGNYKRQRKPKPTQQELQQPLHQPTPPTSEEQPVQALPLPHQRVQPLQAFPLPTSECSSSSQTETNTHSFHIARPPLKLSTPPPAPPTHLQPSPKHSKQLPPNGPTRVHTRGRPSTIDFGITCGINDITAEVHSDLSSDHNPCPLCHFDQLFNSFKQNCKTLTNWYKFQSIIATSLPGNPQISDNEEIEEAIVNFNTHIHNAINQASKFKPILHSISNIPFQTRLKIREKNRLRKLWQRTQYPPLKAEVNRLQRIIRTELKNSKEHVWDSLQKDANIDTDTLHKLVAGNNSNNNIIYPPILSFEAGLRNERKSSDALWGAISEGAHSPANPYDDDHIDFKVDGTIREILNNYSSSIPPLTPPLRNLRHHLQIKHT
ncbi:putative RNA-directed DNA polymerase from transposon X-element [Trichonephila clavipes]|nr:putative RNA-directed DNA polymerase from transposon X-element [Trichonephila clavipes]